MSPLCLSIVITVHRGGAVVLEATPVPPHQLERGNLRGTSMEATDTVTVVRVADTNGTRRKTRVLGTPNRQITLLPVVEVCTGAVHTQTSKISDLFGRKGTQQFPTSKLCFLDLPGFLNYAKPPLCPLQNYKICISP